MTLWLLRHGEAEPYARTDAQRPLTERGRKEVRKSALQLQGQHIDHLLVSPYLRAQQTAELLRETLALSLPITSVDWATPDDDVRKAIDHLEIYAGNCLLISHNPLLGVLAGFLVTGHFQGAVNFSTASLARLDGQLVPGLMELSALYHPL